MARLIRRTWDPFRELLHMEEELGSLLDARGFGAPFLADQRATFPRVNIWTGENESTLYAEVPGVELDDLDLTIAGTTLTLKGERKPGAGDRVPAERHYRRERGSGPFGRSVVLPHKVDVDKVEASLVNGILRVTLPKAAEVKPHKIAVKS